MTLAFKQMWDNRERAVWLKLVVAAWVYAANTAAGGTLLMLSCIALQSYFFRSKE